MTRKFAIIALLVALLVAACDSFSSTPSAVVTPTATSGRDGTSALYVENRGGDGMIVKIGTMTAATVTCGQSVTLVPGQSNLPSLPWDVNVSRASDGTQVVAARVVALPHWIVQSSGFQPAISNTQPVGTFGPCPS